MKAKGPLKVFVQAGGWSGRLVESKYDISRSDSSRTDGGELKSIEATNVRTNWIFGILGGGGLSYRIGEGHVFTEINLQKSFTNINRPEYRLDNKNLVYNYYFIDDDLRINNLTISLGYSFYLNYFVERSKAKK